MLKRQLVANAREHREAFQIVIAVGTARADMQGQINLGGCETLQPLVG
jgi:hypothetical protein